MKRLALDQGHRTLLQDGLIKASHGRTTLEEFRASRWRSEKKVRPNVDTRRPRTLHPPHSPIYGRASARHSTGVSPREEVSPAPGGGDRSAGVRIRVRRPGRSRREGAGGGRLGGGARPQVRRRRQHRGRGARAAGDPAIRIPPAIAPGGSGAGVSRGWRRCSSPGSRSTMPCRRKAAAATIRRSPVAFQSITRALMRGQSFRESAARLRVGAPRVRLPPGGGGRSFRPPGPVVTPGGRADALRPAGRRGDAKRADLSIDPRRVRHRGGAARVRLRRSAVLQPAGRRKRSAVSRRGRAAHRRLVQRERVVADRGARRRRPRGYGAAAATGRPAAGP